MVFLLSINYCHSAISPRTWGDSSLCGLGKITKIEAEEMINPDTVAMVRFAGEIPNGFVSEADSSQIYRTNASVDDRRFERQSKCRTHASVCHFPLFNYLPSQHDRHYFSVLGKTRS